MKPIRDYNPIDRPIKRNKIRLLFGKQFFTFKRFIDWFLADQIFACVHENQDYQESLIKHKSILLRPLKDVDMYLQHNKVDNLKLAVHKLNGVVIFPGETFSIWKLIGRPSRLKGYKKGLVLQNGNITQGYGGGLCQLGNLVYWMVLHTPLKVTERWRHGFDVFPDTNRTIPFGCGVSLAFNYVDLQFKNESNYAFKINVWIDDTFLHGEIKCDKKLNQFYEIFESDHVFIHQWWGGYTRHNRIWKRITDKISGEYQEQLVCENNAIMMYNPLLNG
jgi:vancomycin resistance protein VanW